MYVGKWQQNIDYKTKHKTTKQLLQKHWGGGTGMIDLRIH